LWPLSTTPTSAPADALAFGVDAITQAIARYPA
jgi:hypothetical protein